MRHGTHPHPRRGFTLLELVVVVCLVGILFTVAAERFLRYQELAEKAAMEATVASVRSALTMQAAARILKGGLASASGLADENPFDWLSQLPGGYLGPLYAPALTDVAKGTWHFDLKNKELVYRPLRTRYFIAGPDGSEWMRFRVIVGTEGLGTGASIAQLSELTVRPAGQARWTPEF